MQKKKIHLKILLFAFKMEIISGFGQKNNLGTLEVNDKLSFNKDDWCAMCHCNKIK